MTARRNIATTNRREFIKWGGALAAFSAAPLARSADPDVRPETHRLSTVLVDRSNDAGAQFAAEATRRGASVRMIGHDLGGVWMSEIEPRWRNKPAAIAGLTGAAPLFCLELMALDYGMRIVYRAEHSLRADGRMAHTTSGSASAPGSARALAAAGARWSAVAAALATTCPAVMNARADTPLLDLARRPDMPQQTLFSWVIAPYTRSRVTT